MGGRLGNKDEKIIERGKADIMETPAIKRAATKYHDENVKQKRKAMVENEKVRTQMYKAKDKGQWELHKQMKEDQSIQLVAVRRKEKGPRGQPAGTIATSPQDVDGIIRKVYGGIYKGNLGGRKEAETKAKEYIEEYGEQ